MPSDLPITASILARETGLSETKAASLIEAMRLAGMTVWHARVHLVFREDVNAFLRQRQKERAQLAAAEQPKPSARRKR